MKALTALAKKLPKGSLPRVILESAQKSMDEHDQRYERERERTAREREQLRAESDAAIDDLLRRP